MGRITTQRFVGAAAISVVIITLFLYPNLISIKSSNWGVKRCLPVQQEVFSPVLSHPIKRHNVVVASEFGHHFDVYMSVAWTLERVTNKSISVYAGQPFYHNFNQVIQNAGIHNGPFYDFEQLHTDLAQNSGDGAIDLVVFGTCEIDLRELSWSQKLLKIWDSRDEAHKFQIVCMVHNADDTFWHHSLPDWTLRNAIRFVVISENVRVAYRQYFTELADDHSLAYATFEHIPIDVLSPVLYIPDLHEHPADRVLSNAIIQGSFSPERRDYEHFFAELTESLYHDPRVWGYLPLGDEPSYVVDNSLPDPPFKLHLLGSGELTIPPVLKNVALIERDLNYSEYYTTMNSMDICIPAFGGNQYYTSQASSTMFMAMESNLPILVTRRMREAYNHVDDDRVVVTRPAAMSELAAIRALRTRSALDFFQQYDSHTTGIGVSRPLQDTVDQMMRLGWRRTSAGFSEVKQDVWNENDRVIERLLRDL